MPGRDGEDPNGAENPNGVENRNGVEDQRDFAEPEGSTAGFPVQQPEPAKVTAVPGRMAAMAAAIGAGVGAGLLGTSLHGHAWYPGGTDSAIPYGAVLALLLLVSVSTFVGLWSRSSWIVVWCGAAAYLTAGLLSLQLGGLGMIFDNIQGRIWLYGIAVVTPLTAWLVMLVLRGRRRAKGKQGSQGR